MSEVYGVLFNVGIIGTIVVKANSQGEAEDLVRQLPLRDLAERAIGVHRARIENVWRLGSEKFPWDKPDYDISGENRVVN